MFDDHVLRPRPLPALHPVAVRDAIALALCDRSVPKDLVGRITIQLPSGKTRSFGQAEGPAADISFMNAGAVWACMRRGTLGFAEAYMDGAIQSSNIAQVFRFFIDNRARLESAGQGLFETRKKDRRYHSSRANTRHGSKRNISEHYDLGNAFYKLWLDPGMVYSSGIYRDERDTLEAAQDEKLSAVLQALELAPGDRLLEIGCGWGGLAEAAGQKGAQVTAVTVSQQQYDYSAARMERMSLADRVAIAFQDYRDTEGRYDRIASIEMVEAVGAEHWPVYFQTIYNRLKDQGHAVIQAITIRESSYNNYAAKPDFIQRYIFPGGMLPTKTHLAEEAQSAGLSFEIIETFGPSYQKTLAEWRVRFHDNWPQIQSMGFDEKFRRLWDYYLQYCEVGFERGVIDVGLYRFARP